MDGGGWWEPGFSLLEKEATDKQWGKARMNHVVLDQIHRHQYELTVILKCTQIDGYRNNYRYVCKMGNTYVS